MGKDLRLVKLNEEISGKEKVWLCMILKEPRRNFFDAVWQQISRG